MNTLDALDAESLRADVPDFRPGDTLKVHVRVIEGTRSRVQVFQGVVIRRQGGGVRETFTVRKVSFGVGVERTFPVHTPVIDKIEVVTRGDVRRAKLYYLRDLRGKAAKIKEKRDDRRALSCPDTQPRCSTTARPACRRPRPGGAAPQPGETVAEHDDRPHRGRGTGRSCRRQSSPVTGPPAPSSRTPARLGRRRKPRGAPAPPQGAVVGVARR